MQVTKEQRLELIGRIAQGLAAMGSPGDCLSREIIAAESVLTADLIISRLASENSMAMMRPAADPCPENVEPDCIGVIGGRVLDFPRQR